MSDTTEKPVKCIEDDKFFNNVRECMEYYGAPNRNTISRVCRGERKTYKGKHFIYIEEGLNNTKQIIQLNGNVVYDNLDDCCDKLAISKDTLSELIVSGNSHPEFGKFKFLEDFKPYVMIVETGEKFETVVDCAIRLGTNRVYVSECLSGKYSQIKGYHVKYCEEE